MDFHVTAEPLLATAARFFSSPIFSVRVVIAFPSNVITTVSRSTFFVTVTVHFAEYLSTVTVTVAVPSLSGVTAQTVPAACKETMSLLSTLHSAVPSIPFRVAIRLPLAPPSLNVSVFADSLIASLPVSSQAVNVSNAQIAKTMTKATSILFAFFKKVSSLDILTESFSVLSS